MKTYLKKLLVFSLLLSTLNALEISSFSGDAKFYYGTADDYNNELFKQAGATGQFSLALDTDLRV